MGGRIGRLTDTADRSAGPVGFAPLGVGCPRGPKEAGLRGRWAPSLHGPCRPSPYGPCRRERG